MSDAVSLTGDTPSGGLAPGQSILEDGHDAKSAQLKSQSFVDSK